jgi:hypothetical protein
MPIAATCAWHSITRDPPGFEFLPCVVLLMLDWRLVMNMLSLRSIIRFDRVPDQRLAYKTCLQLRNAVLLRRGGASARRHLKNLIVFALHHTDMCRAHQFVLSSSPSLCTVSIHALIFVKGFHSSVNRRAFGQQAGFSIVGRLFQLSAWTVMTGVIRCGCRSSSEQ